jgi:hypothetical protein
MSEAVLLTGEVSLWGNENLEDPDFNHSVTPTTTILIGLKKDPTTGEMRLFTEMPDPRRVKLEEKLKAVLTLYDRIVEKGGDWMERDLSNLEVDASELVGRNSYLTGIDTREE